MDDSQPKARIGFHHTRHELAERGNDLYETPPAATQALLKACQPLEYMRNIWEPAVGRGAIAHVLEQAGKSVIGQDLLDYGAGYPIRRDFLNERIAPPGVDAIITNPPYRVAQEFAQHAIDLVPDVFMLLRLSMLEGQRVRFPCFNDNTLRHVYVFKQRLPFMHRDGWEGKKIRSSGMAFAWFWWDRTWSGHAGLTRISL
jgi:tRNA G10  N-methylase Trm11